MSRWVALLALGSVAPGTKKLVPVDVGPPGALRPTRLLVVHHSDGSVHVVDGRCPHEGYPLSDALVDDGCVLTCAWHNWKFDLRTGDSTLGGEGVQRWPSRVVDGVVEADVQGPDPLADRAARFASLTVALTEGRLGRGLRDSLRLLVAGVSAVEICAHIAQHDALYAEWGTTHALPVAADCARLASQISDPFEALHSLAPALDMAIDAVQRSPRRPGPTAEVLRAAQHRLASGEGRELLAAAVEAEDADAAEGIVRAAGGAGVPAADVEGWFLHAIAAHFTDFGHALIYLQKLRELRLHGGERISAELLTDLHAGLAVSLAYGTREDTLPYMRRWFAGELPAPRDFAAGDLLAALIAGKRDSVLGALSAGLANAAPAALANELILGGAHRLEWFDEVIGEDPDIDEDWLSATHRFTASLAIAELIEHVPCTADDAAALLRQGAAFVSLGRATDRGRAPPRRAVQSDWRESALLTVLNDRFVRAIRLAHGVKTLVAAGDAMQRLGPGDDAPIHALQRFFDTPAKQRRLRAQVGDAVRWLRDGKPPKRLTR